MGNFAIHLRNWDFIVIIIVDLVVIIISNIITTKDFIIVVKIIKSMMQTIMTIVTGVAIINFNLVHFIVKLVEINFYVAYLPFNFRSSSTVIKAIIKIKLNFVVAIIKSHLNWLKKFN